MYTKNSMKLAYYLKTEGLSPLCLALIVLVSMTNCKSAPPVPNPYKEQGYQKLEPIIERVFSKQTKDSKCAFTATEKDFYVGQVIGNSVKEEPKASETNPKEQSGKILEVEQVIKDMGTISCPDKDYYLTVLHSSETIGEFHLIYPDFQKSEHPKVTKDVKRLFPSNFGIDLKFHKPDGTHNLIFLFTDKAPDPLFDSQLMKSVPRQVLYGNLAIKNLEKLEKELANIPDYKIERYQYKVYKDSNEMKKVTKQSIQKKEEEAKKSIEESGVEIVE